MQNLQRRSSGSHWRENYADRVPQREQGYAISLLEAAEQRTAPFLASALRAFRQESERLYQPGWEKYTLHTWVAYPQDGSDGEPDVLGLPRFAHRIGLLSLWFTGEREPTQNPGGAAPNMISTLSDVRYDPSSALFRCERKHVRSVTGIGFTKPEVGRQQGRYPHFLLHTEAKWAYSAVALAFQLVHLLDTCGSRLKYEQDIFGPTAVKSPTIHMMMDGEPNPDGGIPSRIPVLLNDIPNESLPINAETGDIDYSRIVYETASMGCGVDFRLGLRNVTSVPGSSPWFVLQDRTQGFSVDLGSFRAEASV